MSGDINDFEIVWSGSLHRAGLVPSLIGDRDTKVTGFWEPPHRLYNISGKFIGKFKRKTTSKGLILEKIKLDNYDETVEARNDF